MHGLLIKKKNYDLIERILEEIEMVDKILNGLIEDDAEYRKNNQTIYKKLKDSQI